VHTLSLSLSLSLSTPLCVSIRSDLKGQTRGLYRTLALVEPEIVSLTHNTCVHSWLSQYHVNTAKGYIYFFSKLHKVRTIRDRDICKVTSEKNRQNHIWGIKHN
jgi:hypothetical protein